MKSGKVGRAGREPLADARVVLHGLAGADGVEVLAPLIAVGRIDELEVEAFAGQLVVGKGAAARR